MDVLLAPVYASFLAVADECFRASDATEHGAGFVVGPIGDFSAEKLWDGSRTRGVASPAHPHRFAFKPMLPCLVYESHTDAIGTFRFAALVDEIEINGTPRHEYRCTEMKPGRGVAGARAKDEILPAYVRIRVLRDIPSLVSGLSCVHPRSVGLSSLPLRRFMFAKLDGADVERALSKMLA